MVTTVGTENEETHLLRNLIILEHDAIAAYDSTIEKLESAEYRAKIEEFRSDHHDHVRELNALAEKLGVPSPQEGDMKQWLTTGKVAMASLAGDSAVLGAMKTNEDDTVSAYESALNNSVATPEWRPILEKGLADERRHRAWMEQASK
ncbi:ferritin-like domain-containing protein [Pseudosulfitobacter koreensis]|uniref:Ferritin-like domain-containing protein n=1 Tax=Pseudosulfitobacter koreensis TaxID=2968472 RepID=A0ABT1Z1L6_9RHOB|nr:ferritin-like domain-containing protein [Pseudosulfitobacter koreense]MCR8827026.1 ferritin-like domain-containing protein [Pseudosulfitobacter koreense]